MQSVVWMQGKAFNPASTGYEIVKAPTNAFAGTELARLLAAIGRKNLNVGSFTTHIGISASVRTASDQGFMSTIAADTVATRDLLDATGGATIHAAAINRIPLAALSNRFARFAPTVAAIA